MHVTERENQVYFRWMMESDLGAVMRIEQACFETPNEREDIAAAINKRNQIGLVAEIENEIVGFTIYRLGRRHIKLLTVAVAPEDQRRGVGTALVQRVAGKLSPAKWRALTADSHERDLHAHLFLRSLRFRAVDIIPDHYGPDAPAYRFRFTLGDRWVGHAT